MYPGIYISRYLCIQVSLYPGIWVSGYQGIPGIRVSRVHVSRFLDILVFTIQLSRYQAIQVSRYPSISVFRLSLSRYPGPQVIGIHISSYQYIKVSMYLWYTGIHTSNYQLAVSMYPGCIVSRYPGCMVKIKKDERKQTADKITARRQFSDLVFNQNYIFIFIVEEI